MAKVIRLNEMDAAPTPLGGMARILLDRPEVRVVNLTVDPGTEVGNHTAPVEVLFMVLAGKGILTAAGDEITVEPGMCIICPPDVTRSVRVLPGEPLNLLVVRSPNL
ncbi:MAG: cupin domain-containing protein [Solirubrobacterales bacterium]